MLYTFPFTAADPKKLRPWTGQHLKKVFWTKIVLFYAYFVIELFVWRGVEERSYLREKNINEFFFLRGKLHIFQEYDAGFIQGIFYIKCVRSSFMVPATFQS